MKLILTSLLSVFLTHQVSCQNYDHIPFPDSNMVWNGYYEFCAHGYIWYGTWTFELSSDTIIRNITYHKIAGYSGTFGFIRKDSTEKIYYIMLDDTLEYDKPLYDFSLEVGDTLVSGTDFYAITSIDTPIYIGVPRKTLHVISNLLDFGGHPWNDRWIEGIGSPLSPLGLPGWPYLYRYHCNFDLCDILVNDSAAYISSSYCSTIGIH